MAESNRQVRTSDAFDRFDEAINDPGLYPTYQYEGAQSRQLEPLPQDRVPLFLSDYDQQYEQQRFADEAPEYTFGSRQEKPRMARVVAGIAAATAVAAAVGFFAVDATRTVFVNAKASLASVAPSFGGGAAPPETAPPARAEAAAPQPRIAAPEAQAVYRGRPAEPVVAPAAAVAVARPAEAALASPSREEISAAYQSAVKGGQVAAVAPVAAAPAQAAPAPVQAAPVQAAPAQTARRMDPDEVAGLLKRAKSLLAIGDFVSARLLLERAADAQEAEAALMLGTTYDPVVVGNQDMRSITPDPAMARHWYQKAATLGSADARRRLSQIQN